MKDSLIIGDTLDFATSVPDYPASAGYTLKYRLIPRTSGSAILLTASAAGEDYRVQYAPATTASWTAGEYTWSAWVEKTGERYSVDSGTVTLKADPGAVAAYDGRTHARKMLEQIETALEGWAATGGHIAEYEINGRRMKYADRADVLAMRNNYKAEVWREDAAAKMASGLPNPRQVRVRMARA
jgi:hypothetical protein